MTKTTCSHCRDKFISQHAVSCPDDNEGCLVLHLSTPNWVCPNCEYDNTPLSDEDVWDGSTELPPPEMLLGALHGKAHIELSPPNRGRIQFKSIREKMGKL